MCSDLMFGHNNSQIDSHTHKQQQIVYFMKINVQ